MSLGGAQNISIPDAVWLHAQEVSFTGAGTSKLPLDQGLQSGRHRPCSKSNPWMPSNKLEDTPRVWTPVSLAPGRHLSGLSHGDSPGKNLAQLGTSATPRGAVEAAREHRVEAAAY